jgi:hypothetical protein
MSKIDTTITCRKLLKIQNYAFSLLGVETCSMVKLLTLLIHVILKMKAESF